MKQAFRLSSAFAFALTIFFGAHIFANAQNPSPTPDPFVAQITTSTRDSFTNGTDSTGRFVIIESTGDIATKDPTVTTAVVQDNSDGNREIFLFDYAQRRIFQLTNTKSARVDTTKPAFDPTKPLDRSNVRVEVSSNQPVISYNSRWVAFRTNALTPGSFDGDANSAALIADGNQEIWLYLIPAVPAANLSSGADVPFVDLTAGTFTRVTDTPASAPPRAGTATVPPYVADDNRDVAVNDNGTIVAFTSVRNLTGGNADFNPEIFVYNRTTAAFGQVTTTTGSLVFSANPSLSGDGSVLAFISNANIQETGGTSNNADGNSEIYLATINTATASLATVRQITRTTATNTGDVVNVLSPGRRLSRNGNLLAFESTANLSSTGANQATLGLFLYNIGANTFTQVAVRATAPFADLLRFPTFTGDDSTLVFTSVLNFKADGTAPATSAEGLNPNNRSQIFSSPVTAPNTITRLTNTPAPGGGTPALQPFPSDTIRRITFSLALTELGGGNADFSSEAFYLLTPLNPPLSDASATISYFTGASQRPVVGPSPSPTPPAVAGLAPDMLGIARSTTALAPSNQNAGSASRVRRPPLPVELNGVSVAINGALAGLYFVGNNPNNEIRFVVPPGLAPNTGTNTYPVVINNNGAILRSSIQIQAAQPDIFTDTNGPGGNAMVFNVTNPMVEMAGPFTVTSDNGSGQTVATVLRVVLTGVQGATKSQITIRIGTTDITGTSILTDALPRDNSGFYQIDFQLPASLAGAGDVPIIVTVTNSSGTFTSRPADTAPRIQIN